MTTTPLLWQPSPERIETANITAFARSIGAQAGIEFGAGIAGYEALWRWSIGHPEAFWRALWDFTGVVGERGERILVDGDRMPGARWFPDARLNFAENLLTRRPADDVGDALIFRDEDKADRRVSHAALVAEVSRVGAALDALGIRAGDRVAAYIPNMPEAAIAML
ncbi:MAG: acetyl-coenzyme A synthetase N-terminal domain-containing protein, partial [Betaproteobacteria bacterium]